MISSAAPTDAAEPLFFEHMKGHGMKYQELKEGIERKLRSAAEDFFTVGYYLRQINDGALFLEDGYESIWDFAKGEYGLSVSAASRYIGINTRFSSDGGQTMEEKYIGMGVSKLQEMLTLSDEDLEKVTQETTVRQIRAIKAAKRPALSYFGWPAKVYPEGSLIETKGCAPEGTTAGHDCFSCHRRGCQIRQEEALCRTAALAHPFPCSMVAKDMAAAMKFSINKDRCLHLHPELAPRRAGDNEPTPCCLLCEAYKDGACSIICCDVAKKQREEKRREAEQERARQAVERKKAEEAARRSIREDEWRKLYPHLTDRLQGQEITAAALKEYYGKTYNSGTVRSLGRFGFLNCTLRGVSISAGDIHPERTKEETWATAARFLRDIQKEEQLRQPDTEESPDVIDADFQEIEEALPDPDPETETEAEADPDPAAGTEAAENDEKQPAAALEIVSEEPEKPWRNYTAKDVEGILNSHIFDLEQYETLQAELPPGHQLPLKTMLKHQILTDALRMFYEHMVKQEAQDDGSDEADNY